jgi:two-component system cell cycle sensor histidine kinase/response regulator CckA
MKKASGRFPSHSINSFCCTTLIAVTGLLNAAEAVAGPEPAQQAAQPVITSIQQFWQLPPEQKAKLWSFRIECDVTYFDSMWRILFVQDANGDGAYVPFGGLKFPFKAGEHIIATGQFVPPNADVTFEHALVSRTGASSVAGVPTDGKITQAPLFLNKLVTVTGFVDRYRRLDPGHFQLTLSVEGESVIAWVPVDPDTPLPDLSDANVRVEGVYNPKLGPDGTLTSLEIMIPSLEHLTVLNRLGDDPRFKLPVVPIGSLARLQAQQMVRVSGQVKAQEPGRFVTIRDKSGQIMVMTGQTRLCKVDETVEAVGYPLINGTQWNLASGLFRSGAGDSTTIAAPAQSDTLRVAAQVLELAPDEAARGHSVWLTGVVTWSHLKAPFFFIQDSSGGVCVMRGASGAAVSGPGRDVEVRGVTGMGPFAPVVMASRYDKVSDSALPVAAAVSLEHALTGAEEANWVEMRGYLRNIRVQDGWNNLELVTTAGDFTAVLPGDSDLSSQIGSVVRVHGVCTADTNSERKLTGIKLWVPAAEFVQVEEAAPKDPFDVPSRSLASLGQFNSVQSFNRLLRVSGVVLHQSPGHFIHIEDGGANLVIFSRSKESLEPGDRIDAVGLLGRQGGRVTLREAIFRKTGRGEQPRPSRLVRLDAPLSEYDGKLVAIEGTLIEYSATGDEFRLTLQAGNGIFEAFLDQHGKGGMPPVLANGSLLLLTGVYEVKYDEYGQPSSYQLELRAPADIAVLTSPSWLTRGRILAFACAMGVGILLFIGWVSALRRQVREQTHQIREQVKRESRLEVELQRAGKLESLGLLAGGIAHDFNNLLTVVIGNLSLSRLDTTMEPSSVESLRDAEKAAARARDLTQQLLTFAKGGAPIRAAVLLPEVVREVTEFALRGSKVLCKFDIPDELWPANVDKGQIGQVVQNIVINAIQAMPEGGVIDVSLRNESVGAELGQVLSPGQYLQLTFTDHGAGIRPQDLQSIFDPYFTTKKHGSGLGLATVHSIVKKHLGHISAESTPGKGTTFRIWLPAAENTPIPETICESAIPTRIDGGRARILFMDDEQSIRRLGSAILHRIGYDVSTVSDGTEALREYSDARAAGRPYSAVILDLTIPGGMGGSHTMEQLLKIDPAVRAIVSSGYSNDTVLSNYKTHGFRGMVSKPYETADLALAVERVLKGEWS